MILVTDAHISKARGNHTTFFNMLNAIESTAHDLIFLGDIFDLWIALPRYEEDIHTQFTAWCLEQKNTRSIGFLEGNHEFYLADQRSQTFTWCSNDAWWQDDAGTLFVHGDQINRKDWQYLIFKKLTKNSISKFVFRTLPFGPRIAKSLKIGLKITNKEFRLQLPRDEIKIFADDRFAEGIGTVFVGHFHREYSYSSQKSKNLHVLPDWLGTQKITLYQKHPHKIMTRHWKELL